MKSRVKQAENVFDIEADIADMPKEISESIERQMRYIGVVCDNHEYIKVEMTVAPPPYDTIPSVWYQCKYCGQIKPE